MSDIASTRKTSITVKHAKTDCEQQLLTNLAAGSEYSTIFAERFGLSTTQSIGMSLLRVLLFLAISCHRQVAAFVVTRPLLCSRQQATTSVLTSHFDDDEEENDISHELYWLHRTTTNQDSIYGLNDDDDLLFGESDDNDDDENEESLGKTIGQGKVVVCLPEIASAEECETLFSAAWEAAQNQAPTTARGRSRFSVSDPTVFDGNIVFTAEEILLRVMDYIDDAIPCIYDRLFDPTSSDWASRQPLNAAMEQPDTPPDPFLGETCMNLRDLYMSGALEWSEGEPAINIYQGGGYFGAHKDHLALTVLMPLTSGEDFEG